MVKNIEIDRFKCALVKNNQSQKIVYMIYPWVNGFEDLWLEEQSVKNNSSIVVVYVPLDQWNDCLTPWPEPGETPKSEPFAGQGSEFLKILQEQIIPDAERALNLANVIERNLVGVSLGGLFTLWQWMFCDTFKSIACLSGSFWYDGFVEWFDKQAVPAKNGRAFFLLGTDEPKSHIKAYRSVGVNTESVVSRLRSGGIDVDFEWVPGNHFANPLQRAETGLKQLAISN